MNLLNRLANREFLVLVAIVASAVTMHVRQHVAVADPASSRAADSQICEPDAATTDKPRMLPADCGVRVSVRPAHTHALWV